MYGEISSQQDRWLRDSWIHHGLSARLAGVHSGRDVAPSDDESFPRAEEEETEEDGDDAGEAEEAEESAGQGQEEDQPTEEEIEEENPEEEPGEEESDEEDSEKSDETEEKKGGPCKSPFFRKHGENKVRVLFREKREGILCPL